MTRRDFLHVRTLSAAETPAAVLRWRAEHQSDRLGYTVLEAGTEIPLTYGALDLRARAIAARLRQEGVGDGDRALLLYPPGEEFLAALFGCLFAGVVAVPAFPPDPLRLDRTMPRLMAITADATPATVLTLDGLLPLAGSLAPRAGGDAPRWIATDTVPTAQADAWTPPTAGPDEVAVLQYTSGSTGTPKGVMLTNANLLHNSKLIQQFFGTTPQDRPFSWLPPYHDMGLIGGLLQPLYAGMPIWLMSPIDFLRRPLTWLHELSRLGVTVSGGPDFAYDLCVRKTTPQEREQLDLSAWRVAFNGAEPVRRSTLESFATAFAPAGFRAEAFLPCYGLAEATLIVTGGPVSATVGAVDPKALRRGEVVADPDTPRPLVGSGKAAADQRVEIVDPETRRPCAANRVGEIWVSGPSVAAGYWGREEETREVFRAELADAADETLAAADRAASRSFGRTFLRTGDLGFLRDGELVVTGRLKDLIIIRGRNHAPQDLELTARQAHPALRPGGGAAFSVEDAGRERLVLVQEVVRGAEDLDVAETARRIRQRIAENHEVRLDTVVLIPAGALPKTSSGKVRRAACRRQLLDGELPEVGRAEFESVDFPDTEPELVPVLTRATVLDLPEHRRAEAVQAYLQAATGLGDDPDVPLSAAGLDSLAAQELRTRVEADLAVELPLDRILSGAGVAEVAGLIVAAITAPDSAPAEAAEEPPVVAPNVVAPSAVAPNLDTRLTANQRALWFLHQWEPESTAHITASAFRLAGRLDLRALRRALDSVVARHPALRTTFTLRDGEPVRTVHAHVTAGFTDVDVSTLDDAALADRLAQDVAAPFHLETGPLLRLTVYRRTEDDHLVLVTAHHIVVDFWSTTILGRELEALYVEHTGGEPAALPNPRATMEDVLAWQDTVAAAADVHTDTHTDTATDTDDRAPIGPSIPSPAQTSSSRGQTSCFRFDDELAAELKQRAAAEGVTLYTLLLAGFQALLHRRSGSDHVQLATPLAARTRRGFGDVVGYLMNPVALSSRAENADSFRSLLQQTRTRVLNALEHQDLPTATRTERHGPVAGDPFRTMFVFNRPLPADARSFPAALLGYESISRDFGTLRAESVRVPSLDSAFDLELSLTEIDGEIRGFLRSRVDVLDASAAQLLLDQLTDVLATVSADPETTLGELLRANGPGRVRALDTWNATARDFGTAEATVVHLFEQQARDTPHAVAVVTAAETVTYRDLDERADILAGHLRRSGIGVGSRVGVCLDRGPRLIAAVLAILKSGAAYVPVDPVNPAERVAAVFADAGVAAVLGERSVAAKLEPAPSYLDVPSALAAGLPAAVSPPVPAAPRDAAYIIYTSGSTGLPKGVEVPHRALVNHTLHATEAYGITADDRVLQFASIGFDASAEEIFPTLIRGGCLIPRTDVMLASPEAFFQFCEASGVTVLDLPTSYWHDLVLALERGSVRIPETVRLVIIGGQAVLPDRVTAWRDAVGDRVRLVNTYGPTETTIVATSHDLVGPGVTGGRNAVSDAAIGRPISNVSAYVLDDALQPVATGVVAELYLGGAGLAHGYVGQPGLTASRFVADPFGPPGSRLYRTGDLTRRLPDGSLEFVARADRQLKLDGYRVEPGEVEAALRSLPDVADAAVVAHPQRGRLLAYVTRDGGGELDSRRLREALRGRLPGYMVPAQYVVLPALPRTAGGKTDYAALPSIAAIAAASAVETEIGTEIGTDSEHMPARADEPPLPGHEQVLAAIWCEVLQLPRVGRHDDFFALGGHSLLAAKVLAQVADRLGRDVSLRAIFEQPTLAGMARAVASAPPAASGAIPRAPRDAPLPASFVQQRIWFLDQLEPGSTNYNVPRALRLSGPVEADIVVRTLADLEERHEILRTTFPDEDGEPVQRVHAPRGIPFTVLDRCDLPEADRDAWIQEFILAAGREPFDLAEGPLLRITLVHLAPREHLLVMVEHHLIHDGWAQGVFLRDFLEFYEANATGRAPNLPELPIQYADYALWQRQTVRGERLEALLAHWTGRLAGAPPVLRLPTDRPRPPVLTSSGDQEILVIDGELSHALRDFGREHGATLFMTMFAAYAALLSAHSGQDDVVVGAGLANRLRPELENLLGMIINTVPLRTDLSGDPTFAELLHRVRETCLDAYAHQDMPFDELVRHLRPPRDPAHAPVFQTMFSFLDTPMPELRLPDITLEVLDAHNRSAKFDLNAVIVPHSERRYFDARSLPDEPPENITVLLEYNTDLFDATTVAGLLAEYETILRTMVAEPGLPVSGLRLINLSR